MFNAADSHSTSSAPAGLTGRRRAAAIMAGPVVTLAGLAATPWEGTATTAAYHQALAASPDQAQLAAVLLAFGYSLLGLSAFVCLGQLGRGRPRHRAVAAALSWLGATLMPGLLVTDWYDLALAQNLSAADAIQVSEAAQAFPLGALLFVPAILGFLLGPIVVMALALRERVVGRWVPVAVIAGAPLPMIASSPALAVVSGGILVAAYAAVARGLSEGAGRRPKHRPVADPALDAVAVANRARRSSAAI